ESALLSANLTRTPSQTRKYVVIGETASALILSPPGESFFGAYYFVDTIVEIQLRRREGSGRVADSASPRSSQATRPPSSSTRGGGSAGNGLNMQLMAAPRQSSSDCPIVTSAIATCAIASSR